MAPRRRTPKLVPAPPPSASSWMSLLAETTLGVDGSTVRASIRADESSGLRDSATYRLVVQSYDGPMRGGGRPVGSLQRLVTGADLMRGVDVSLVELRAVAPRDDAAKALVVAWIQEGAADLELDGRAARPQPHHVSGATRRSPGVRKVTIALGPARKVRLVAA